MARAVDATTGDDRAVEDGGDHHTLAILFNGQRFIAACGCGWTSLSLYSTSGLAGAAWDAHFEDIRVPATLHMTGNDCQELTT